MCTGVVVFLIYWNIFVLIVQQYGLYRFVNGFFVLCKSSPTLFCYRFCCCLFVQPICAPPHPTPPHPTPPHPTPPHPTPPHPTPPHPTPPHPTPPPPPSFTFIFHLIMELMTYKITYIYCIILSISMPVIHTIQKNWFSNLNRWPWQRMIHLQKQSCQIKIPTGNKDAWKTRLQQLVRAATYSINNRRLIAELKTTVAASKAINKHVLDH